MRKRLVDIKSKITLAVFLTTLSLYSDAVLPDGEFACQVLTQSGQSGLVMVQTDAEADAISAASAAIAWEMDGGQGETLSVVECISVLSEEFKDSWFNRFYKDFPR
jgi:hypothetical protein